MADSTVVGSLRVVLGLDTAKFEAGARKATAVQANFQKSLDQLRVKTAQLTPAAERMANAFGGQKLLTSANNLTAAVQKLGGAARLTEAEQRRVNVQLTAAIEKYRALGIQAPPAMLATARATQQADAATSKWSTALGGARTALAAFGVTLGAGVVLGFARELLNTADNLVRVADRTGLTTTEVQKLEFVARQSGNTIDDFTGAIGQLQNRLISGDKGLVQALKFLNISLQEFKAATPLEQVSMLGKGLAAIEDPAVRARVAFLAFGRAGLQILPTLIADFDKLAKAAPVMSDATVRALDEAGDRLDAFGMQLKVFGAESFNFLSRGFEQYLVFLRRAIAATADFVAGWLELLAKAPLVGRVYADLAARFRDYAQFSRDAGAAQENMLRRQDTEVRKNTGALVDYEALLNRSAESTKKLTAESAELLPLLHEHFRWWKSMPPAIEDTKASLEAFTGIFSNSFEDAAESARQLREQMEAIQKLGMGPFDFSAHTDNKASQESGEPIEQFRDRWAEAMRDIGQRLTMSISDALADALVGLHSFKDAFVSIWESIRRALSNVLATMLDNFIEGFLKGILRAIGGAKLGEAVGNALMGSAAGAALGGGAGSAAGGIGSGAGGAGGAAGFLANPAFWTNPWTIGAAAAITTGLLVWKKGLFRGGEEALKVSPRRDSFFSQFGDVQNRGVGGAAHNLAAKLTQITGQPGGGAVFRMLQIADTVKEWTTAQSAAIATLAKGGMGRGIKSYQFGGFTPPGVTELALVHGGMFGEMHTPLQKPLPPSASPRVSSLNVTIYAMDGADAKRVFDAHLPGWLNREYTLNQHGTMTPLRRGLER